MGSDAKCETASDLPLELAAAVQRIDTFAKEGVLLSGLQEMLP